MAIRELDRRLVDEVGLWRMPASVYHADPCEKPSLSHSVAKVLLGKSPRHAWYAHPRLNDACEEVHNKRFDLGTVAHTLLLGQGRDIVEIAADNFMTKEAKRLRDEAYAVGKTPILSEHLASARAMEAAAREQLVDIQGCEHLFDPAQGDGEVVCCWREDDGPWCRAQIDWLPHNRLVFADYKTVDGSAHPDALGRRVVDLGYDVQAAFYELGLSTIDPDLAGRIQPVFIFQECTPPFELCAATLDEETMTVGRKKVELAIRTWQRCLETDTWPGYPPRIVPITMPTWALQAWLEREAREHFAMQDGYDPVSMVRPGAPGGGRLE